MALIRELTPISSDRTSVHDGVDCGYRILTAPDHARLVQLDTYGSDGRKLAGKASQSIQIDEARAQQLIAIFLEAFPALSVKFQVAPNPKPNLG